MEALSILHTPLDNRSRSISLLRCCGSILSTAEALSTVSSEATKAKVMAAFQPAKDVMTEKSGKIIH